MFKANRQFQAGLNLEDSRRQRQNESLSLRRKARETKLQNKRKKLMTQPQTATNQHPTDGAQNGEVSSNPNNEEAKRAQEEARKKMLTELPRYVEGCYTKHSAAWLECTTKIRELLSFATNVPIEQVMKSGVVPRMIDFLSFRDAPKLQLEALWVITNMASSDNPQYTAQIVTSGGIPPIIAVLTHSSYALQEQALWALGNIAGESAEMRDLMVSEDECLSSLVAVSKQRFSTSNGSEEEFVSMLRTLSWSVSNFCRHFHLEKAHCRLLVECLYHLLLQREEGRPAQVQLRRVLEGDAEIQTNIGWSFSYLTNDSMNAHWDDILEMMMKHSITAKLISFLDSANISTCTSNLRAIGNVLTGHDKFTANCVECGVLPKLYAVLCRFQKENVNHAKLKEVLWALSNITASEEPQTITAVVQHSSFAVLMAILRDSRTQIAAEALWTVSNATSCNDANIIRFLLSKGVVEAICTFWKKLESANYRTQLNEKLIRISFECVENVLGMDDAASVRARDDFEEHGGLDFLEALQSDDRISQDVYEHTVSLIKRFWADEEDGEQQHNLEQQLNAPIIGDTNQFGFGLHSAAQHEQPQTYSAFDF